MFFNKKICHFDFLKSLNEMFGIRKFKLHIRNIFCPHWKVKSDTNVGTKDIVGDPAIDFSVPVRSSLIQIIAAMSSHGLQQKCFKYSINFMLMSGSLGACLHKTNSLTNWKWIKQLISRIQQTNCKISKKYQNLR